MRSGDASGGSLTGWGRHPCLPTSHSLEHPLSSRGGLRATSAKCSRYTYTHTVKYWSTPGRRRIYCGMESSPRDFHVRISERQHVRSCFTPLRRKRHVVAVDEAVLKVGRTFLSARMSWSFCSILKENGPSQRFTPQSLRP